MTNYNEYIMLFFQGYDMAQDKLRDVTNLVGYGRNDAEALPIKKCICGAEFADWHFVIYEGQDDIRRCPKCGRSYFFKMDICVYTLD